MKDTKIQLDANVADRMVSHDVVEQDSKSPAPGAAGQKPQLSGIPTGKASRDSSRYKTETLTSDRRVIALREALMGRANKTSVHNVIAALGCTALIAYRKNAGRVYEGDIQAGFCGVTDEVLRTLFKDQEILDEIRDAIRWVEAQDLSDS